MASEEIKSWYGYESNEYNETHTRVLLLLLLLLLLLVKNSIKIAVCNTIIDIYWEKANIATSQFTSIV